jgi:hypothetical protein
MGAVALMYGETFTKHRSFQMFLAKSPSDIFFWDTVMLTQELFLESLHRTSSLNHSKKPFL